jgi:hypothetical protein
MRSKTLHDPSSFPSALRGHLEEICRSGGVKNACKNHTESPGSKLLDRFFKDQLLSRGYSVESDRLLVARNCRFDLDLLITGGTGGNWVVAVLLEGGKAARIDLDLLKFIAWGRTIESRGLPYGVLIASDKKLSRTITGTPDETAFDYLRRLRPLFLGTESNITDILVIEFEA